MSLRVCVLSLLLAIGGSSVPAFALQSSGTAGSHALDMSLIPGSGLRLVGHQGARRCWYTRNIFFENCWWRQKHCSATGHARTTTYACVSCPDLPSGGCPR